MDHTITLEPVQKMDTPVGLFRPVCSCGWRSQNFGNENRARKSGHQHADAKGGLPEPDCRYGYPAIQLAHILGPRLPAFQDWMSGQTVTLCDGREWDHETHDYVPTHCGPHGVVTYPWDLKGFLAGAPNTD